jgi:hypothetical protein
MSEVKLYKMENSWGNTISWTIPDQFLNPKERETFDCHGWQYRRPEIGDHLLAEFVKSWMTFEFVEVEYCRDPTDMFFAKVRPIKMELKNV